MTTISCTPPTPEAIAEAARHLLAGRLAILPTDTVYGLFADVRQDAAVEAVAMAKGKPAGTPLQLLFPRSGAGLEEFAVVTPAIRRFIETVGPGGWSIVAEAAPGWGSPALAGGATVGFRLPNHDILDRVIERVASPLCASSANIHGNPSPSTCGEAVAQVGRHSAIALNGGRAAGLSSTVIDLTGDVPTILREGLIDRSEVARILGVPRIDVVRTEREGAPRP